MLEKEFYKSKENDMLFEAILSLESVEECYSFFQDICTFKEISDMVQRLVAAKMLLNGETYDAVAKEMGISTATISRINRCIRYGTGGYKMAVGRLAAKQAKTI